MLVVQRIMIPLTHLITTWTCVPKYMYIAVHICSVYISLIYEMLALIA